jgi:hypothetical protein
MNNGKKINDLCGDAVVDFVNANSTDEACLWRWTPKVGQPEGVDKL